VDKSLAGFGWLGGRPGFRVSHSLQWLMIARSSFLFLLLTLAVLGQIFQASGSTQTSVAIYAILAIGFAFNVVAASLPEGQMARGWVTYVHVFVDISLISIWISLSNGRESLYALLYLVQILLVSLILYQRAALLSSLASVIGFGVVLWFEPPAGAWLIWGLNASLFLTLGVVGGYLSEELHRASLRIAEKTERIEKLIALQERILSHMPTGLLAVDASMRIGYVNSAAEQLLGVRAQDVSGKLVSEVLSGLLPFFNASSSGSSHSRLQQLVEVPLGTNKQILRGDVAMLNEGEAFGALLHGEAVEGCVLLFQDVTKLISLEDKIRQNEKLAAVGQLAAGIAHEIRNPLAGMSASIEMLRSSLPSAVVTGENLKLMDIAIREIDRLNGLITDFLDYVKPQKAVAEKVDVRKQISEVLFSLKNTQKPGVIPSLKGSIPIPAAVDLKEVCPDAVYALANSEKLRQVLWNLIINAMQAMHRSGTIEVGCRNESEELVKVWVRDEGQGMSAGALAHLYEPFFTTKEKGTGLGLATVYKLVEAFQGEIKVVSKQGEGTLFEVFLPRA
jgi:two-component system, NtrC family, sensor histidine kinase PilS